MIAIGVGCRRNCPADEIVALVREGIAMLPPGTVPGGLFSIEDKRGEAGLAEAAEHLGLPLAFISRDVLQAYSDRALTVSPLVERKHGLPSVAETAALAGAGEGAVLLTARRASAQATCAIAGRRP